MALVMLAGSVASRMARHVVVWTRKAGSRQILSKTFILDNAMLGFERGFKTACESFH